MVKNKDSAKKEITEKGILEDEIKSLMSPQSIKDMDVLLKNPTLQQFFLRLFDKHDLILGDELRKTIVDDLKKELIKIYRKDNVMTTRLVVDGVMVELKEYLAPWNEKLENIENNLEAVGEWQISVNSLIRRMDERIESLENKDEEYDVVIKKFARYMGWKQFLFRKIIIVLLTVALTLLIVFQILDNKFGEIKELLQEHMNNTEIVK